MKRAPKAKPAPALPAPRRSSGVDEAYSDEWEALLASLNDTSVGRREYEGALETMVDELEGRLSAVREEMKGEDDS